jgi:hypothetical protein
VLLVRGNALAHLEDLGSLSLLRSLHTLDIRDNPIGGTMPSVERHVVQMCPTITRLNGRDRHATGDTFACNFFFFFFFFFFCSVCVQIDFCRRLYTHERHSFFAQYSTLYIFIYMHPQHRSHHWASSDPADRVRAAVHRAMRDADECAQILDQTRSVRQSHYPRLLAGVAAANAGPEDGSVNNEGVVVVVVVLLMPCF